MRSLSRRDLLAAAAVAKALAARPRGYLVDSLHLFSDDQLRFPYHRNATYRPPPKTVEAYSVFVREVKIDHTVIIHSEVYQDDHRYLRYAFEHEPTPGYFKGTCLFDPIDPKTPARIEELVHSLTGRIVGIRIHEFHSPQTPPTTTGPMRDRDMRSAGMKNTWRKMRDLGLGIEMQSIPYYAPQVSRSGGGIPRNARPNGSFRFANVWRSSAVRRGDPVAKLPRVYLRVEGLGDKPAWYGDPRQFARRAYDSFGPGPAHLGRIRRNVQRFEKTLALIDELFGFAPEEERAKIRGLNAMKLFGFPL
jgi:predicted TIM-barrel fold metal-dependent hydrolase